WLFGDTAPMWQPGSRCPSRTGRARRCQPCAGIPSPPRIRSRRLLAARCRWRGAWNRQRYRCARH
ncbi:MAG: hypothetical protein AVDCRST_MAG77-1681, partial [uncultured Chloroflexi bacterium]